VVVSNGDAQEHKHSRGDPLAQIPCARLNLKFHAFVK
jgi:hypothetical protein